MYIEFLAPSPKAGQKEHVSIPTGTALITAGFAHEIPVPGAPIPRPHKTFFELVIAKTHSGAMLRAVCERCGRSDCYQGKPSRIAEIFLPYLCVHFRGVELSKETIAVYAANVQPELSLAGVSAMAARGSE